MAGPTPPGPTGTGGSDSATARSIRFAVYLTGGLVMLAFGISGFSSVVGEVLTCVAQTDLCSGGVTQSMYLQPVPARCGEGAMIAIGAVLLFIARGQR